jgi:hypothetical protein
MGLLKKSVFEGPVDEYQVKEVAEDLRRLLTARTFTIVVVEIGGGVDTDVVRSAQLHQRAENPLSCVIFPTQSASLRLDFQYPGGYGVPHSGMFLLIDLGVSGSHSAKTNYMRNLSRYTVDFTTPWVSLDETNGTFEFRSKVNGRMQIVIITLDPLGDDSCGV